MGVGSASGAEAEAMSTLLGQIVFPLTRVPRGDGELKKAAAGEESWLVTRADRGETSLEPGILVPWDDIDCCCHTSGPVSQLQNKSEIWDRRKEGIYRVLLLTVPFFIFSPAIAFLTCWLLRTVIIFYKRHGW